MTHYPHSSPGHLAEHMFIDPSLSEPGCAEGPSAPSSYEPHAWDIFTTTCSPYGNNYYPTPASSAGSPPLSESSLNMASNYSHREAGAVHHKPPPATPQEWAPYSGITVQATHAPSPLPMHHHSQDFMPIHPLSSNHSPEPSHPAAADAAQWGWPCAVPSTESQSEVSPTMRHAPAPMGFPSQATGHNLHMNPFCPSQPGVPAYHGLHAEYERSVMHTTPDTRDLGPDPSESAMQYSYQPMQSNPQLVIEPPKTAPRRNSQQKRQNRSTGSTSGVRKAAPKKAAPRKTASKKTAAKKETRDSETQNDRDDEPGEDDIDDEDLAWIELRPEAPEDVHYLLALRKEHTGILGNSMWELIGKEFTKKYGDVKTRECLQMKFTRSVCAWAIWPESEEEALRKAVSILEAKRYQYLIEIMEEQGGRRFWKWNQTQLATKAVEMGLEQRFLSSNKRVVRPKKPLAIPKGKSLEMISDKESEPMTIADEVNHISQQMKDAIFEQYDRPKTSGSEIMDESGDFGIINRDDQYHEGSPLIKDESQVYGELGPNLIQHPMAQFN